MKKTKPVKGSARTKRFLDGGAVGALAGLGTLAYLMSRKKKDGDEGKEGGSKFEDLEAVGGPGRRPRTIEEQTGLKPAIADEQKRAMAASQGRPELIPEGADESVMRSDTIAKRVMPTPKKVISDVGTKAATKTVEGSVPKDKSGYGPKSQNIRSMIEGKGDGRLPPSELPKPGESKAVGEGSFKPYPKDVKPKGKDISTSGVGPKITYGTPSQLDAAKASMRRYREEQKEKKTRSTADIRAGRYRSGGSVSSASKRADGIAQKGKTKGRIV